MKQDDTGISVHDVLKRAQLLAAQSHYSEMEIVLAISLCMRNEGVGLDEAFEIIEGELKKRAAKGW